MIVGFAAQHGADRVELAAMTGFDAALAADPDAQIPLELESRLWDLASEVVGDEAFGVHAAEALHLGVFDVLDYVVRTAATLRDSLGMLARYNRLVHETAVIRLSELAGRARVDHSLGGLVQSRHAAEFTIAALLVISRQIATVELAPLAVEFRHPRPAACVVAEHARLFGLEPSYDRLTNSIELDSSLLDRPLRTADPTLFRVVERHAEALLAARPQWHASTVADVRRVLTSAFGESSAFTLEAVAGKLHMSERSLQRRLAADGLTFEAVLDETRRDLAIRFLSDGKIAISEVAFLLGYSEASAFHRAFKRWTGRTPNELRRSAA